MQKNILFYGGSFNPIHNGHLITARYIAEKLKINKVILIPSGNHPLKRNLLKFEHRYCMTCVAVENDKDLFEVSFCEQNTIGPSYTLDTVRHFRATLGNTIDKIHWLIGEDILPQLADWHGIEELSNEAIIVTASRPGYSLTEINRKWLIEEDFKNPLKKNFNTTSILNNIMITPQIDISSTNIRERVKNGLSIKNLIPEKVEKYIREKNLYKV
jgi:nicotinate-nucleotide adenylyltransferase